MKDLLKQLAQYNLWANQRISETALQLNQEAWQAVFPSSFESLEKTMLHLWDVEVVWWQRIKLVERLQLPGENFKGSPQDIVTGLVQQSRVWVEWVQQASDLSLEHVFSFQNSKREMVKLPVYQVLIHVFNHATYHRGQVVNLLRQAGMTKIPATDFLLFCRRK